MTDAIKNARGPGGHQVSQGEIHGVNDAAPHSGRTPSIDAVAPYRGARLTLIPLHRWNDKGSNGKELGKAPADRHWTTKPYDTHAVLERAAKGGLNIGVRLPPDVVVLDVDTRNFPEGRDSLAELVADTGLNLDLAPHVLTGSGGHHYYYRKPADVVLLDSLTKYQGLEFKSFGRQVVAPGSIHPNGRRYEWHDLSPSLAEMPDMPANILAMARRPERVHGASDAGEVSPELLAKSLEPLDPCDFGEGQHDRWMELMMACHYATDGEGRQEFIDWCEGDPQYLDHGWLVGRRWDSLHTSRDQSITTATLRMFLHEVGADIASPDPEDDFDVWEEDAPPTGSSGSRWRFMSIADVEALPPPKWVIPGVLVESSIAAIYGAPESGKSFLAVDMAMAVAGGLSWHSRKVDAGGVLYIAAEGAPGLGKRMRAWKVEHLAQGSRFLLHLMRDELNLAADKDAGARAFVQAVVDELGPLRLIVIDTLNQTAAGADENSAKDMSRYIASMKRLRDATGATVVVVHHSGKDVSKGMRGSTALLGAMDTTVEVERATDGRSIKVSVKKQKDAEREVPMRFNLERVADSLVLRPTMMADAAGDFGEVVDPILELARQMAKEGGGSIPLKELVKTICSRDGVSDKTARRDIEKAVPEGRENAKVSVGGGRVWQEPETPGNPKRGILIRTEG